MLPVLDNRRPEIQALCKKYGVLTLDVFGSAATGSFVPGRSDVDHLPNLLLTARNLLAQDPPD
jgi:hypothetical protein